MMFRVSGVIVVVAALAAGCSGGTPTQPTNPPPTGGGGTPPPGGGGSQQTTTITIDASGRVTPNDITVPAGTRVTFINNHNRNHEMNSDPHPNHGDCPGIDQVGFITPGQTKLTGNLTQVRVCGFHDHNEPTTQSLTGVIRVQ